jgi:hypothetical protein
MRPLRIFTIAIVSLLAFFLPVQPSGSCIDSPDRDDLRFSAFQPDLGPVTGLDAFYFSASLFHESRELNYYWGWGRPDGTLTCDEDANAEEWKRYCGNEVSIQDIQWTQYHMLPYVFFEMVNKYWSGDTVSGPDISRNSFISYLARNNPGALQYMRFAKKCEHYHTGRDPWTDKWQNNSHMWDSLYSEGVRNYHAIRDTFLKVRYGYQLVRLGGAAEFISAAYDTFIAPLRSESIIKYWALSFKAVAVGGGEGNYLLSKVFERVQDKQRRAMSGYDRKYLDDALMLARTAHEKAILLVMDELRNPGRSLRKIRRIYKIDPKCRELEMLVVREVNKIEDWLLTPEIMKTDPAAGHNPSTSYDKDWNIIYHKVNRDADKRYLEELRKFISQTAAEGKVHTPALWHVAAGYLGMISGEHEEARQELARAANAKGKNIRINTQLRITRSLIAASSLKTDSTARETIEKDLLWLDKNWKVMYDPMRTMQHFMLALSEKYLTAGDTVTAALFRYKTMDLSVRRDAWDGYFNEGSRFLDTKGSPRVMDRLVQSVKKKKKSKFERFITREALADIHMLHDLQGTWHLRHDHLEEALAAYCNVPDSIWNTEPYTLYLNVNPFYVNLDDPHRKCKADSIKYTKPQMIEKLISLKAEAAKGGPQAAEKYLLIGNAYYSMTWHGNSWMMIRPGWSNYELEKVWWLENRQTPFADEFYYGCARARKYFLEAMKLSKDPEKGALACLMVALCDKNYARYRYRDENIPEGKYRKYFLKLSHLYGHTEFYDKLIDECPGLAKYIAKYN